jgi:hypothetical protein
MRLCVAFVNRKTVICSVFGAFSPYFSRFQWFLPEFGDVIDTPLQSQLQMGHPDAATRIRL